MQQNSLVGGLRPGEPTPSRTLILKENNGRKAAGPTTIGFSSIAFEIEETPRFSTADEKGTNHHGLTGDNLRWLDNLSGKVVTRIGFFSDDFVLYVGRERITGTFSSLF